jgi:hypothetical protein
MLKTQPVISVFLLLSVLLKDESFRLTIANYA